MRLVRDYETRCDISVVDVGPRRYASDPSCEALCVGWCVDDAPPQVAILVGGSDGRAAVERRVRAGGVRVAAPDDYRRDCLRSTAMVAHNIAFEIAIEDYLLPDIARIRETKFQTCTASRARRLSLPGSLEDACKVLRTPHQKAMEGHGIMLQCSQPRPAFLARGQGVKWFEDAERLAKVAIYCAQDIDAERDLDRFLPELPPSERIFWQQTERMNRRGVPLDGALIDAMTSAVAHETEGALARVVEMTGDRDFALTNPGRIISFCASRGLYLTDLRKETVEGVLAAHRDGARQVDPMAIAVLEARRDVGGKSSTSKLPRMRGRLMSDGRARDMAIYHGAHTGRDTGDGINVLNLPRPYKKFDQDVVVDALLRGDVGSIRAKQGVSVSTAVSAALRGVITAGPGRKLVIGDYASVEPCFYFSLVGQWDAVEILRRRESLYLDLGRTVYGRTLSKTEDLRDYTTMKETTLGCSYGLGKARFNSYLALKGVTLPINETDRIHDAYHARFPKIKEGWRGLEAAAKTAMKNPGATYAFSKVSYHYDGWWLVCVLPSGRPFYYPDARLIPGKYGEEIVYQGWIRIDGRNAGWGDARWWGGTGLEQCSQSSCRDIMEEDKQELEAISGWEVLLTVYDEIVCGAPDGERDAVERMKWVMSQPPAWLPAMPCGASVFESQRYRKD